MSSSTSPPEKAAWNRAEGPADQGTDTSLPLRDKQRQCNYMRRVEERERERAKSTAVSRNGCAGLPTTIAGILRAGADSHDIISLPKHLGVCPSAITISRRVQFHLHNFNTSICAGDEVHMLQDLQG